MNSEPMIFEFNGTKPERLDHFLNDQLPDISRSRIQQIIKSGGVLIDNTEAGKTGIQLVNGQKISIFLPEVQETTLEAEDIALDILYEDENCLVINKAAGMVVHPSAGHHSCTLVHAVLAHVPETLNVGGEERPGVVHRLDKTLQVSY